MTARAPVGYEIAHRDPLVLLATAGDARQLEQLAEQLARDFAGERFIAIVTADHPDDIDLALTTLGNLLAEVIFTASSSSRGVPASALAMRALEVVGVGQDFVFTVAELPDAIRYGIDALAEQHRDAWEGTAILVLGPAAVVDEARGDLAR